MEVIRISIRIAAFEPIRFDGGLRSPGVLVVYAMFIFACDYRAVPTQ